MDELRIDVVPVELAGELLTVRRAAFVTEAQLYDDPKLPALTQTLDELKADLARDDVITLGGWIGTRLVGSVRVGIEDDKANLSRLAVVARPAGQGDRNHSCSSAVLKLPARGHHEVWVFTGQDSKQNLALYAKAGFEHQYVQHAGDLTYAYLRKILGELEVPQDDEDAEAEPVR